MRSGEEHVRMVHGSGPVVSGHVHGDWSAGLV